jgi:hypothetical protein
MCVHCVQAYNLEQHVLRIYQGLLHGTNVSSRKGALIGGLGLGYSMFVMFAMYSLVTWFGGLEVTSCRSTFDEFLKAFFCVLFAAMGLAQAQVRCICVS